MSITHRRLYAHDHLETNGSTKSKTGRGLVARRPASRLLLILVVVALSVSFGLVSPNSVQADADDWNVGRGAWNPPTTDYRIAGSITTPTPYYGGSDFGVHAIYAACRWSSSMNFDNAAFSIPILSSNSSFYFVRRFYGAGDQYNNSLGFANVADGYVGMTYPNGPSNWYIRFSVTYYWTTTPETVTSRFDFQSTASHELGHAAGLGHADRTSFGYYNDVTRPTMFAAGAATGGVTWQRTPAAGDIEGMTFLY